MVSRRTTPRSSRAARSRWLDAKGAVLRGGAGARRPALQRDAARGRRERDGGAGLRLGSDREARRGRAGQSGRPRTIRRNEGKQPMKVLSATALVVLAAAPLFAQGATPATPPAASPAPALSNTIKWSTASEVEKFGSDVFRGDKEEGPFKRRTRRRSRARAPSTSARVPVRGRDHPGGQGVLVLRREHPLAGLAEKLRPCSSRSQTWTDAWGAAQNVPFGPGFAQPEHACRGARILAS